MSNDTKNEEAPVIGMPQANGEDKPKINIKLGTDTVVPITLIDHDKECVKNNQIIGGVMKLYDGRHIRFGILFICQKEIQPQTPFSHGIVEKQFAKICADNEPMSTGNNGIGGMGVIHPSKQRVIETCLEPFEGLTPEQTKNEGMEFYRFESNADLLSWMAGN